MANIVAYVDLDYSTFIFTVLCSGFALGGLVALFAFGRNR